jgi:hypothetical protein
MNISKIKLSKFSLAMIFILMTTFCYAQLPFLPEDVNDTQAAPFPIAFIIATFVTGIYIGCKKIK